MANPNVADVFKLELENSVQLMETLRKDRDQLRNEIEQQRRNAEVAAEQIRELIKERNRLKDDLNMWKAREESQKMSLDHLINQNTQLFQQIRELKEEQEIQLTKHREEVKLIQTQHNQQIETTREDHNRKEERINHLQERQQTRRNRICFMIIVFSLVTLIFLNKITGKIFEEKLVDQNKLAQQMLDSFDSKHRLKDLEESFIFKMKTLLEEKYIDKTSANKIEVFNSDLATRIDQLSGNLSKALSLSSCNSNKFIFVTDERIARWDLISAQNIEQINYFSQDLGNLLHNASFYRKELLVMTEYSSFYDNLLLVSQQWKKLISDGEIHCIFNYLEGEEPTEPSLELKALFTTSHRYQYDDRRSGLVAIRKYWPAFSDVILTNEAKLKL